MREHILDKLNKLSDDCCVILYFLNKNKPNILDKILP